MTQKQREALTAHFGWAPFPNEDVATFIKRMEDMAGGDFKERNKLKTFREQDDAGKFFPREAVAAPSGTVTVSAKDLVGSAYAQQGVQGVQQEWFTSEADAYEAAATAMGTFSDPKNLTDAGKRAVRKKFNIYAQQGRFTFESRAPTATGPYKTDIVGSGETRTLILSQDGKRVASSHLGAALTDYTEDELNVVRQEITGSDERFVLVQARGKTIAQWRESTLDEIGETSFQAAWEQAGEEGIPVERRDVKTSIAPDGSTRYFPAIKPAGAPEADIGTTEKAETTFISLGEGQGELLLYKTGNQVGSVRISPKPGKTIQNTFSTPGGGVRAVFSDGSEEVYGEEDFTLGSPVQRMGPNGQMDWYIESAPGRYDRIPETFKPTVVRIGDREFTQDVSGRLTPLAREFDPGITQIGGRTIMQQPTGQISELQRQFEPGVITDKDSGLQLLQQPSGAVSQTRAANMNEIIAQALVDGHWDKALAYQDFVNRPSAKEAFDAALSFARSPADQQLVSSIARGETPVAPPPPGVVQRIGPQPDFLVQAYNEFQQRLRGGRPPTPEEQSQYAARYRSGETPLSDELRLKMKTQEDANERAIEKLELQRETNQRNFDLKMQQQEQDFSLRLAQATGSFSPVGEQRYATEEARRLAEQDDVDNQKKNDPTGYINDLVAKEIGMTPTDLSPMEKIAAGLQKREAEYTKLWSELNTELSAGVGGKGKYAGIVSSDEIQQWMRTATQNAGTNRSIQNELIFEALSDLAEGKYASSGKQARDEQEEAIERTAGTTRAPESRGSVTKGEVITDAQLGEMRAAQLAEQKAGWASPTSPDLFDDDSDDDGGAVETGTGETGGNTGGSGDDSGNQGNEPSGNQGNEPEETATVSYDDDWDFDTDFDLFAKGGMTRGKNLEIVGEEGPELVDLPPGTFVLPIKGLNQRQVRQAKRRGVPGYQSGGIVFDGINYRTQNLPLGLRQQQAGRAITPPRGYLSQAAGLTLPSAQAFQNITPESREVFFDVAKQAGIPQGAFAQELRTAFPGGQRLPVSRNYPLRFRGVR